uniref:Uncharacterized protein n=1 Tax=Palpitomonas bilix TaxID=652834 RepID=A0A7S3G1S3_9EUKA
METDTYDLPGRWLTRREEEEWDELQRALKVRLNTAESEVASMVERYASSRRTIMTMEEGQKQMDEERRRLEKKAVAMEGRLYELARESAEHLSQLKRVEEERDELRRRLDEKNGKKKEDRYRVDEFTQTLGDTVMLSRLQWDDHQDEISMLHARVTALEKQLDRREEREREMSDHISHLKAAVEGRRAELEKTRQELAEVRDKYHLLEGSAFKSAVRANSSENAEMELRRQMAELQKSVATSSAATKKAKASISHNNAALESEKRNRIIAEGRVKVLQRSIEDKDRQMDILKQKLDVLKGYARGGSDAELNRIRKAYDNIVANMKAKVCMHTNG